MAPLGLREKIYALIDNEIAMVRAGREGHIIAKMNSLIDQPVIQKLYEASAAGVHIDLIVRGICGLRTGIEGISDNITVRSIVAVSWSTAVSSGLPTVARSSCIFPVPTGCRVTLTTALSCSSR